jgi:excisionase family DNA binding protein
MTVSLSQATTGRGSPEKVPGLGYSHRMPTFRIKKAARLLGVSTDTLRRWADRGRVETTIDGSGRQAVDGAALAALAQQLAELADHSDDQFQGVSGRMRSGIA